MFILTGLVSRQQAYDIFEVGNTTTRKVHGANRGAYTYENHGGQTGFLAGGNGRIPFAAGTTVRLSSGAEVISLDIQGYIAAP